jgi:hypothetical protein
MTKHLNEYGTYTERILCVVKSQYLTVDKWYDILEENENFYCIWDDVTIQLYSKNFFKTEKQIRKEKLQKINESNLH